MCFKTERRGRGGEGEGRGRKGRGEGKQEGGGDHTGDQIVICFEYIKSSGPCS